jgi:amino acid transporter
MMTAVVVNATLGFVMLVTICFTLGDINNILASATGYPFIQVFYNTTGSYAATNAMTAILIVTLTASTITEVATASRQLWSFARDNGVPFAEFFGYVSEEAFVPFHRRRSRRLMKVEKTRSPPDGTSP